MIAKKSTLVSQRRIDEVGIQKLERNGKNTMADCYIYNNVKSTRANIYLTLGDDLLHVLNNQIVYKPGLK